MGHGNPQRGIDRLMAHPEPEDEATVGGIGDEGGALRAGVGMAQVDIGDPRSHLDAIRRSSDQLRGCQRVVIDLGGEDRVEPPPQLRAMVWIRGSAHQDDRERKSFSHGAYSSLITPVSY
jgi:hypothetical protein